MILRHEKRTATEALETGRFFFMPMTWVYLAQGGIALVTNTYFRLLLKSRKMSWPTGIGRCFLIR
jgi:hypothetical protein